MFANQLNSPKNGALIGSKAILEDTIKLPDNSNGSKKCCKKCCKKVGLTGFTCRCGGLFCGMHRYAEEHSCNYDYKKEGKQELTTKLDNTGLNVKMTNKI